MFGIFGKKGTEKIQLGTRVVRGPNWNHKSEDNGEGFLGTIVALCHSDRTIQVIWDTGRSGKYRADPNQYDLRLFDNAPTDQLHKKTFCFSCKETPIYGMKWTCTKCNINLCTQCYMGDYHDVEHIFERTITSESRRFKVRSRQNSTEKIAAKGIFEGAEVVGGPNLNWNDDHNNDVGYVEEITNWKNKYQRGIVKVFWKNTEIENIHRLGAEGCVDIVCSRLTENATWGNYYPDHLPVIDFDYVCSNFPVSAFSGDQKEQNETNVERILPSELSMHLKIDANEGDIWKGEWIHKTVKPVCIKLFKPGSYKDVIKEASIIKLCSHASVLKLYGVTPTFDWIVMEWFSALNLLAFLRQTNEKQHTIHLKQIINIATQIASGMAHLKNKRILHRSLKAANILIDSFQTVKITGFGYAVILAADTPEYTADKKEEFPVRWLPKEAFKYTYNTKSDVWSYGILLFELISLGDVPYCNMSDAEVVDFVNSGEMIAKPDVGIPCPDLYYARMSQCMNGNVSMRPKFVDLYRCFDGYFDLQMKYENMEKISITELKIDTKSSGEFQIWKGTWLKQQPKLVRIYGSSQKTYEDILGQAGVMQLCDHNNIIQLYGVTPTLDLMVTEFFSEIDLKTFLQQSEKRNKEEKVDLAKLVQIASQVACGMDYLGTKRILHRDLRTAHVLINDKLETKICGFHLAIVLKEDEDHYKLPHEKFPIRWTAIEAVLDGTLTKKSDVWSFGSLLVELTTLGQIPYPGMDNRVVLELVERGYRQPQPSKCPDNIYKIMLSCWHTSPNNRPTFDYLFDFFDNYCESAEPEVADFNPERTHLDIYRILQTELTFDKKISGEENVRGIIWKGEWILKTRKPVCINLFQEGEYKDFIREASIMKLCSHNNVVKLYGITTTVDWIVMEFVYDLNLLEYMRIYKDKKINFNQMLHIAAQVACGMTYLGTKRILHKDLRAANVFIDDYHETKIYGFHLARVLGKDEDEFNPAHGHKFPIKWTAPEAALYGKFTFKSDVWSFGILLVELMTLGQIPYPGLTYRDCLEKVDRGFRHEKPDNCPENIYKIMMSCWNKEPTKRPTFEYLFNYFDDYVVSAELEKEADFNPEQTQLDIYRILQTELTFDKKISYGTEVGEIWTGEWIMKTRKPVCIKFFPQGEYQDFTREASIMKSCSHNNVVKLYGITTTVDWIVMEFVYDLNLLEYMQIHKENKINFSKMLHIAAQVACGMTYLGTKRILHRDLRVANVFIDDYHKTKIYGFHRARVLGKDEDEFNPARDHKCPIKWTAPEAALYGKFTIKSDVWSFGIFLVELITLGQIPYQGLENWDCLEKLERGFRHEKPDNCPENVYKIMLSCWNKEPTKRPTFEYLFNYFDDYVVSAELEKEEEEEEEEDNKEPSGIEVHSDASVDNKILQSGLPPRN